VYHGFQLIIIMKFRVFQRASKIQVLFNRKNQIIFGLVDITVST